MGEDLEEKLFVESGEFAVRGDGEDELDPLSGTAILNGIPVELAPVRAPAATA